MKTPLIRSLFFLRITVFLVMLMWTVDKFVRPAHASAVYETFYFLPGFGPWVSYLIGSIEMLIILGFVTGYKKRWTYTIVLALHALSTLSSFNQYFAPYEGGNLLFFAAWPMLAACYTLYVLQEEDSFLSVE